MLKGDKLLLMTKFWFFVVALFLVCFQLSLASKSERSLIKTAKDGSKYELKIATGGGKIAKKHKHKHKKGKHKHKKSKKSKKPKPKISDGDIESTEKEKSSEKEKSNEKQGSKEKEESKESTESSESSKSCGSCSWGEWSEGECREV